MTYLLDTHALLWWLFDDPRLSKTARGIIMDQSQRILVSAASAWEIATKHRLGRLDSARYSFACVVHGKNAFSRGD